MTWIVIAMGCLAGAQACTVLWLFWLDQEVKALNRYVQGLRVPR
jgi:hypothetical protein